MEEKWAGKMRRVRKRQYRSRRRGDKGQGEARYKNTF